MEAWLTPRNMLLHHLGCHTKFGLPRSDHKSIIIEIYQKNLILASRLSRSLKVIGTDTHRSSAHNLLFALKTAVKLNNVGVGVCAYVCGCKQIHTMCNSVDVLSHHLNICRLPCNVWQQAVCVNSISLWIDSWICDVGRLGHSFHCWVKLQTLLCSCGPCGRGSMSVILTVCIERLL